MAELARFWGIVVAVFFRGEVGRHNRPHIHVFIGDDSASIALDTRKIIVGKLNARDLRLVRLWMKIHDEELHEAWDRAVHGKTPYKIAPLREKDLR